MRFAIGMTSNETKTWLVTGAGRGMGVDFARAALASGHNVVATGRNPDTVAGAVGEHDNVLVTRLDITDARSAEQKARLLLAQVEAHRELSTGLAHDDARVVA
jgi:NAD(P)-dependent dehydrogenase (short-subunit alcohol dehydrogenase family)